MIFELRTDNEGHHIIHLETGEYVGYLEPLRDGSGYIVRRVLTLGNERQKIAFIKSLDEAVPTLAANYEKNPPRWKGGAKAKEYSKWTFYGVLTVARQGPSEWSTARNNDFLEHDGMWAIFKTAEEAMRAADNHMRDGFANCPVLNDSYSWET